MTSEIISALIGAAATLAAVFLANWLKSRQAIISDKEQMKKWRVLFDRPAFKGPFLWHTATEPFVRVLRQLTKAIDTGQVVDERGGHLQSMSGIAKSQLRDGTLRLFMDEVADQLHTMSVLVETTPSDKLMTLEHSLDQRREQVILTLNKALLRAGLARLRLPSEYKSYSEIGPDSFLE